MKKAYNNPKITVTCYKDVIVMSNGLYSLDNIGNLSNWVTDTKTDL